MNRTRSFFESSNFPPIAESMMACRASPPAMQLCDHRSMAIGISHATRIVGCKKRALDRFGYSVDRKNRPHFGPVADALPARSQAPCLRATSLAATQRRRHGVDHLLGYVQTRVSESLRSPNLPTQAAPVALPLSLAQVQFVRNLVSCHEEAAQFTYLLPQSALVEPQGPSHLADLFDRLERFASERGDVVEDDRLAWNTGHQVSRETSRCRIGRHTGGDK